MFILLSVLQCKSHILGNSCSSVIARKAFKGFYIARFSDHIYLLMERLDHIGTLIFFMWTDTCKRKNIQPNFLWSVVLRGFSRVALFLFTISHSKSSFPIRLQCLLLSWKFTRNLQDTQMRELLKKCGILGLVGVGVKRKY